MMIEQFHVKRCLSGLCGETIEPVVLPAGCREDRLPIETLRTIELPPPTRDRRLAVHEAGHAAMLHGFGCRIAQGRVDLPARIIRADNAAHLPWRQEVAIFLGGDLAMRWTHRLEYIARDEDLLPWVHAIRRCEIGGCDRCWVMLKLIVNLGHDTPDEQICDAYRDFDALTLGVLKRPPVWRAVQEIADALTCNGVVDGEEIHRIASRHIEFGGVEF